MGEPFVAGAVQATLTSPEEESILVVTVATWAGAA